MARKSKRKVFVEDKDAAIDLARSVSDVVEGKADAKIKMHHSKESAGANPAHQRPSSSSKSRARLERAKAAVAAQAARAKREKAKSRKRARKSPDQSRQTDSAGAIMTASGGSPPEDVGGKPRKRVTFG
ncbi:hypothetical protein L226DRAFT_538138 [Lentinus tigrinus ALCF2SS1-7]|uniref:Uncharacterized protein n=1 Tax=Lentinus tigrinus ALCF2SS1-6 TaxID=1328759 RepID=A0A5C2RVQ4_9APHY|nr:hypothetical protein L227DRAFT_579724 [Lentinus tigrinus ALCF2SS1-6]RPD71273.1 hypothetical protein L226DRAFT_538138 [Lentinus tigrinus ALCF2SS1-7]